MHLEEGLQVEVNHSPSSELFFNERYPRINYGDYDDALILEDLRMKMMILIIRLKKSNEHIWIILLIIYVIIMKLY